MKVKRTETGRPLEEFPLDHFSPAEIEARIETYLQQLTSPAGNENARPTTNGNGQSLTNENNKRRPARERKR
jgi:hypothetical protein